MLGDFNELKNAQKDFFARQGIRPAHSKLAIDFGAGNGIQTVALAESGYSVKSIDFSTQLLAELMQNANGLEVEPVESFILHYLDTVSFSPELITCMGDTITHMENEEEVIKLIHQRNCLLVKGGKLVISFRDISRELEDTDRFMPVKNDSYRILTCFLEYFTGKVRVTDLFFENQGGQWIQGVSSYFKLRLAPNWITSCAGNSGFRLTGQEIIKGMHYLVFEKK
jgi:hypothetical protein